MRSESSGQKEDKGDEDVSLATKGKGEEERELWEGLE